MNHPDPYFNRDEVSNSDLGMVDKLFQTNDYISDATQAYRFGSLVDAIITEPERVNEFRHKVDDEQYSYDEFMIAKAMKKSFLKNEMYKSIESIATFQEIMNREMFFEYSGFKFSLPVRCKWDLWMPLLKFGGDIKSTTAKTHNQFLIAIDYFNYDRQRAFYMDIAGAEKDLLFGISKSSPHNVFTVPITKQDPIYINGREKYQKLAFKYWCLFHDIKFD